jgi:Tfp pilus assembly protein PilO
VTPQPFWRRRLLVPFLIVIALNAVAFGLYTLPRTWQERNREARVVTLRAEVERERRVLDGLKHQANVVHRNTEDVKRFYDETLGTRSKAYLGTLEDILKMARQPGLQAGSRSFHPEEVKGLPLIQVSLTLPIEGSYKQLVGFLSSVEKSPRFLTVDKVALRENRGRQEGTKGALNVALSAYFRTEPEAAGDH